MSTKVKIGKYEIDRDTAEAAVCFLAGRCNYASTHDGVGFSKVDVEFGHSLAEKVEKYGHLTERQHAAIVMVKANGDKRNGLIHKYRKQLTTAGFNVEAILDSKPAQRELPLPTPQSDAIVYGFYKRETDRAVLVDVGAENADLHWFPKSRVKIEQLAHGEVRLTVPAWLMKEKGIAA